jgi:3-oxoacyl-[acyl-carrier-protein] synthase II
MPERKVVITGMGIISPLGNTKDEFWNNLLQGKTGIGLIDRFDTTLFPTKIAAQVNNFTPQDYIPRREARRMDPFVQYACAAAKTALEDANLQISSTNAERIGVWVGSGIGGIQTLEKTHSAYLEKGAGGISPFFIPMMIANMAAGQISIMSGAKGPNACTVSACATGTHSIGDAFHMIRNNKADVMIAGGTEASITPLAIGGFCSMKAMSTWNDNPSKACRPFDAERNGFVMGEGAGIVILEELEHALARGAKIYAELIGYGASADASHIVQPDIEGTGPALAFNMAIEEANIKPEEVDYINAHGTGTSLNDKVETTAIKKVFGAHSNDLVVTSTKAATGHMLGAAGAVELIATTLAMVNNTIPPTLNLETPDPDCDLNYNPGQVLQREIKVALSDSLGFGGHNAALIIKKY